ncbi:MAG: hypothetical protein WCH04_17965, partial [Gammaproteobacteria bacterium]
PIRHKQAVFCAYVQRIPIKLIKCYRYIRILLPDPDQYTRKEKNYLIVTFNPTCPARLCMTSTVKMSSSPGGTLSDDVL